MQLKVDNMTYSYGGKEAVDNISIHVNKGEFVGVIGPNGSGKSTLLKNIYRALTPDAGTAVLDGEALFSMSHKKTALKMGVVGQENEVPFDFTVEEIVAMGRTPHKKLFEIDNEYDREITNHALEHVGMESMAKRSYLHLSGGEKQRVIIARVIAQESDFLILDEPTNHLDISYQMQVLDFVKRLEVTVLSAIHDLNMAALYCDRIYVLKDGKIVLEGTPKEVLTPKNIYEIYGVHCDTAIHPLTGKVSITFLPASVYA
ncbi:ABC transporter ATP-binding protein [Faecalicatena contorta]|uniref:Iron complex transport system ATP-binding protein n=1 Tax=Faecalicatena contorta TaxID=39482 RepID=A0A316AJJ7_9FIRM|nr:ABC transporter ATP-binding protein [Faecalicatena contorta]PWJ50137.1 iron complex transport system ATP-binding protein [Faecalicatena contorta]SUQ14258.1 iron complex transport system ATP-binding protein [Faecalicatena contorta]